MNASLASAAGRKTFWIVALVIAAQALVFHDTVIDMADMWMISVYKHCWLVPLLTLGLTWRQAGATEREPWRVGIVAMLALPLLAAAWFVGERASIRAIEHLAFVAMVIASIWAVIGWPRFRRILFPIGLLLAAVPIGDFLIPTLMDITASIAARLLELTGVPAFRQSEIITLPNGAFHVAEVCSGISYVLASLILALVYAYFTFVPVWKRAVFVAVTVASFMILNGLRAYLVMIIANATEMRWFTGWDHVYFGQFLFFCLAVGLYFVGEKFSDRAAGEATPMPASPVPVGVVGVGATTALALVLTAGLARGADAALAPETGEASMPAMTLGVAGCGGGADWIEVFEPSLPGAASASGMTYECGDSSVGHYVAVFDDPATGSELINRQHRYWPDNWTQLGAPSRPEIETPSGPIRVGELTLPLAGETRVVWYVYSIGDRVTANPYMAKFWEAYYTVTGRRVAGRLDLVTTSMPGDLEGTRARLAAQLVIEQD